MLTYCLQIFLVKYKYLRSFQLGKDQGITGNPEKQVCNHMLAIFTTNVETGLKRTVLSSSQSMFYTIFRQSPTKSENVKDLPITGNRNERLSLTRFISPFSFRQLKNCFWATLNYIHQIKFTKQTNFSTVDLKSEIRFSI